MEGQQKKKRENEGEGEMGMPERQVPEEEGGEMSTVACQLSLSRMSSATVRKGGEGGLCSVIAERGGSGRRSWNVLWEERELTSGGGRDEEIDEEREVWKGV